MNSYMCVNTRQLTVDNQTDRDTPIRGSISSQTNITPVLLTTHYPCKLTVFYFLYYIPCTRARFDKNELGGSGGRTGGERGKGSTDKNLTRPFFLPQLNFWSTPLPGIRDFDDLFCCNSVFVAPLCLGSEISTTFFLLQLSFRSTPLSATRYFDDLFLLQFSFCSTPLSFDQS